MNTRSLKTIIAVNIFVLLSIAVGLINFVMVATSQRAHLTFRLKDHQTLMDSIRADLVADLKIDLDEKGRPEITRRFDDSPALAGILFDQQSNLLLSSSNLSGQWRDELLRYANQAGYMKKRITHFDGKTWGVFLPRQKYLIVAGPIMKNDATVAAIIATVYHLSPFYAEQRQQQGIIIIYALINILILTALGTMVISRSTIRPIHRLVKRAEEYQESPGADFSLYREKNEFQQLSGALNRMLQRIADDKEKLQASLTNLEQANRELRHRQNELIKAEKLASVGRLSAGLAHEIGNPVGIVLGYLDLLKQRTLTEEEKKDYIFRCQKEANRINVIIRELLDFSRSSADDSREPVPVHGLIREAVSMLQVQPLARNININCRLEAENDRVSAVPDRLRQMLINLILNAIDAVEMAATDDGAIDIKTETESTAVIADNGRRLIITIADNGIGIADDDLDNIFDPFFTTKEPGRGTGLGLSVCYMIVEGMDGDIKVGSRTDQGTTVTVRLPLCAEKNTTGNTTGNTIDA